MALGKDENVVREAMSGAETLGFKIVARPDRGFDQYLPCEFKASKAMLGDALCDNSTTLVVFSLQRVVRKNVFRVDKMSEQTKPINFKDIKAGDEIVE